MPEMQPGQLLTRDQQHVLEALMENDVPAYKTEEPLRDRTGIDDVVNVLRELERLEVDGRPLVDSAEDAGLGKRFWIATGAAHELSKLTEQR